MTSYNRVNGLHVAEDPWLLRDILRKEFGLGDGLIMSDWSGTYSSSDAIKASLDLEMPGPAYVRGVCVERDVVGGKLKPSDVDECVRRVSWLDIPQVLADGQVLNFVRHAQQSGIPFEAKEGTIDTPEVHALLREAADASIVLLKNESDVLPVTPTPGMKIAVIGSNAKNPPYAGGGSANLLPTYTITPLQAIEKVAADVGGTVQWEMGVDAARWTPLLTDFLSLPDKVEEASVVRAALYDVE
jgi:beta-glucosidase